MTRNLKALGLALVAVFAMSAMAASSASATDVFTSVNSPETITGTSENNIFEITVGGGVAINCTTASFHGNINNKDSQVTVTAAYNGTIGVKPHTTHCGSDLGTLDINMNGCAYWLTGETTGEDPKGGGKKDATVWVECNPSTNEIIIKATELGVTLKVPAQTPTEGGVVYTNEAGGKVKVTATATGITWTCEPKLACNLGLGGTEGNNADYRGDVEVHGANGKIEVS